MKEKEIENKNGCVHYWIIGPINDGISIGICKKCREEKEFSTSFYTSYSWNSNKKKNDKK